MRRVLIKTISLLSALSVLFLLSTNTYAVDNPKFVLTNTGAQAGETVTVELNIVNNPGITSFGISLSYSSDKLELIGVQPSESFSNGFTSGKLSSNPFRISWYNTESEDVYANGMVAIYTFRIIDLSEPAEISISYKRNDVFNSNFENRFFETENTIVSIHDHIFDSGTVISQPSCVRNGKILYSCTECSYTKTEIIPSDEHMALFTESLIKKPDCTDGVKKYTCEVCGYSFNEYIPALGHIYSYSEKGASNLSCQFCGDKKTVDKSTMMSYWNNGIHINKAPERTGVNNSGYLDLDANGIINAKDFARIIKSFE